MSACRLLGSAGKLGRKVGSLAVRVHSSASPIRHDRLVGFYFATVSDDTLPPFNIGPFLGHLSPLRSFHWQSPKGDGNFT